MNPSEISVQKFYLMQNFIFSLSDISLICPFSKWDGHGTSSVRSNTAKETGLGDNFEAHTKKAFFLSLSFELRETSSKYVLANQIRNSL